MKKIITFLLVMCIGVMSGQLFGRQPSALKEDKVKNAGVIAKDVESPKDISKVEEGNKANPDQSLSKINHGQKAKAAKHGGKKPIHKKTTKKHNSKSGKKKVQHKK